MKGRFARQGASKIPRRRRRSGCCGLATWRPSVERFASIRGKRGAGLGPSRTKMSDGAGPDRAADRSTSRLARRSVRRDTARGRRHLSLRYRPIRPDAAESARETAHLQLASFVAAEWFGPPVRTFPEALFRQTIRRDDGWRTTRTAGVYNRPMGLPLPKATTRNAVASRLKNTPSWEFRLINLRPWRNRREALYFHLCDDDFSPPGMRCCCASDMRNMPRNKHPYGESPFRDPGISPSQHGLRSRLS